MKKLKTNCIGLFACVGGGGGASNSWRALKQITTILITALWISLLFIPELDA